MRVIHQTSRIRTGFTLVEVMVAAALSVVIMTIISYAFQVGLTTTSQLKSIGGLADQLRTAHSIIRTDLRMPHLYEVGVGDTLVSRLTGSPAWVLDSTNATTIANTVKYQGFFHVSALTANAEHGGAVDGFNQGSALSNTSWLHFTVKLNATAPEDAFAAIAPSQAVSDPVNMAGLTGGGQFASQWAEVAYFLAPMGTSTIVDPPATAGLPLYTLRRRQRVLANADLATPLTGVTATDYPELSLTGTTINTPSSITQVANRLGAGSMPPIVTNTAYQGSDIVLGNVISMRVMVVRGSNVEFTDLGGDWDTATFATGAPIRAIRIQLRVYEPKNRLSRQITIDQAL